MTYLKGIDLSHHNGTNLNFNFIRDNFDFVICKAGGQEDQSYTYYTHSTFHYHRQGIVNPNRGWYWFNGNKGTPAGGGAAFGNLLNANSIPETDIVVLDIEDFANGPAWTPSQAYAFFTALLSVRPNARMFAYMNGYTERSFNWSSIINLGVKLWIANWGANNGLVPTTQPIPRYWSDWSIWQYTAKGCLVEDCVTMGNAITGLDVNIAKADAFSYGPRPDPETVAELVAVGHLVKIAGIMYDVKKTSSTSYTLTQVVPPVTAELNLKDEPLYNSSISVRPSRKVTGKYWYWDQKTVKGRRRITNQKDRVGKLGQVTGWIQVR